MNLFAPRSAARLGPIALPTPSCGAAGKRTAPSRPAIYRGGGPRRYWLPRAALAIGRPAALRIGPRAGFTPPSLPPPTGERRLLSEGPSANSEEGSGGGCAAAANGVVRPRGGKEGKGGSAGCASASSMALGPAAPGGGLTQPGQARGPLTVLARRLGLPEHRSCVTSAQLLRRNLNVAVGRTKIKAVFTWQEKTHRLS